MKEYPVDIIIANEEGVYKLTVTNSGISGYLLPVDATNFVSTDGTMTLKFTEENKKVTDVELHISSFGITVTGKKK